MAEPIGVEVPYPVLLGAYKERVHQLTEENVQLRAMLAQLHVAGGAATTAVVRSVLPAPEASEV